jgi:integrase
MAWLEKRNGRYRIKFRYCGKNYQHALKTANQREAEALLGRLEDNLILMERGKLEPPSDGELGVFLISDGRINAKPKIAESLPLGEMFRRYQERFTQGAKEASTRYTEKIHMSHLESVIGKTTGVRSITAGTLQRYVEERAKEKGRGEGLVSHVTIKKEIGTFASIWNKWALPAGLVAGTAPTKGLVYRKDKSNPPFQTWKQIERKIERGGLSLDEQDELWESLYLSTGEVQELLDYVKSIDRFPFGHAMFVFAAHTGVRRSEIMRSQIDDFDFVAGTVRVREKKRDNTKELTFRHVPLSPLLSSVMQDWLKIHPGGHYLICTEPGVPLTPQMAAHYFIWSLEGSKWHRLRGWHTLRHSFISNCASKGVDQRTIDAWSGHQTDAMRKRYTHLFPDDQSKKISQVFELSKVGL